MANLSEDITQADINAATEANRALLQERFPDLDLSVGGPVDSLLVDGNVTVTAQNDADTDRAYLYQQLQQIANGEVTIDDDELDRLMANYFLTRKTALSAAGSVVFVVRDNQGDVYPSGYRLEATNGQTYQFPVTYNVFAAGSTGVDTTDPTNIILQQVYDVETGFNYQFTVDVESVESVPEAVLVSGDRLTAVSGFDGLGYIQAVTNFEGGQAAETNQEFAARGLEGITAQTVGGQNNIDALVQATVQRADSNSVGVNDATMSRDRDNVFNISTGGKLDVYCKSGAIAQTGYNVTGTIVDDVARTVRLTLTRAQAAGVYRTAVEARFTSSPPTFVSGSITVQSTSNNAWTDTSAGAFNPTMPDEFDRAFSARQEIEIIIVDDRQTGSGFYVDMTGGPGTEIINAYVVSTEYQPSILELDAALSGRDNRPPGVDVLVKAAVPCITTIGVVASVPTEYNGPDAESIAATIATGVNLLEVETLFLDSFTISDLLTAASPDLTLVSVAMSGTIYGQDGTDISVAQISNRITLPTNTASKVSPRNTYFSTTSALVSVTLV